MCVQDALALLASGALPHGDTGLPTRMRVLHDNACVPLRSSGSACALLFKPNVLEEILARSSSRLVLMFFLLRSVHRLGSRPFLSFPHLPDKPLAQEKECCAWSRKSFHLPPLAFHLEQRFPKGGQGASQKGSTALPATPETLWAGSRRGLQGWVLPHPRHSQAGGAVSLGYDEPGRNRVVSRSL